MQTVSAAARTDFAARRFDVARLPQLRKLIDWVPGQYVTQMTVCVTGHFEFQGLQSLVHTGRSAARVKTVLWNQCDASNSTISVGCRLSG